MLEISGSISNEGKLTICNPPLLAEWRMKHAGKDVVLTLKLKRPKRSNQQNGYYWSVVVPLVQDALNGFGNEFDEMETHEFLKAKFNSVELEPVPDNFIEVPLSTSKLDTKGFMLYIEKIQQFASAMLGVYIPSTNEQTTIDFYINEQ